MAKKKATREPAPENMHNVTAIILGGGRGTRLYPLTRFRAKPAVPLCGRYRLIDIPISNCIHSGINRISVLTQFNSHSLNRHISNTYKFDDFTKGYVQILAAEQTNTGSDWFQGTADAVRKHMNHIVDYGVEHFIVLSGDHLYRMDYRQFFQTHLDKDADITVAALPVSRRDAEGFGVMKVARDGRIKAFHEKPKEKKVLDDYVTPDSVFSSFGLESKGRPYMASMGVYYFKADVMWDLLNKNDQWVDFGKELIPNAMSTHRTYAHMFSGYWEDIGTVRSYFDVTMAMTKENPPFEFHDPQFPIYTHARMLPGARTCDVRLKDSIICSGTRIDRATITNSIIGIRSVIKAGAVIKDTVVLGADYYENEVRRGRKTPIGIGENSKISQAIIDHNARIGKNVVIRGAKRTKDRDGDGYSIRDGIVVVHKDAVIPDGTVIS